MSESQSTFYETLPVGCEVLSEKKNDNNDGDDDDNNNNNNNNNNEITFNGILMWKVVIDSAEKGRYLF